jgi:hypothetical protein
MLSSLEDTLERGRRADGPLIYSTLEKMKAPQFRVHLTNKGYAILQHFDKIFGNRLEIDDLIEDIRDLEREIDMTSALKKAGKLSERLERLRLISPLTEEQNHDIAVSEFPAMLKRVRANFQRSQLRDSLRETTDRRKGAHTTAFSNTLHAISPRPF